jgi:hypothetical protein
MKSDSIVRGTVLLALVASAMLQGFACSSSPGSPSTGGAGGEAPSSSSSHGTSSSSGAGGGTGGNGGSGVGGNGGSGVGGNGGSGAGGSATGGGGGVPVNNDDYVYPADSVINGETFGDFARDWWIWALGIDVSTNPIFDGPCDQDQPTSVFYLAGNTGGSTTRSCTVPSTAPLFFPILNEFTTECVETSNCPADPDGQLLTDVTNYYNTYPVLSMKLEIDGVSLADLSQYFAQTDIWNDPRTNDPNTQPFYNQCTGPIGANQCGVSVGAPRHAAANGYWIMMKPLAPGSHVVHFVGHQQGFVLDVTYNLTVQ